MPMIIELLRNYNKSSRVEMPHAPGIFKATGKPVETFKIENKHTKLLAEANQYEVELTVIVGIKINDRILAEIEVKQAGLFKIEGFVEEQVNKILQTDCLNLLYPYVTHKVCSLALDSISRPLLLRPLNFNQVYEQLEKQKAAEQAAKPEEKPDEDQRESKGPSLFSS